MRTFLEASIVPKFEFALHSIDINTIEQFVTLKIYFLLSFLIIFKVYLEIFDWIGMINENVICQILIKHFFPRVFLFI